MNRTSRWSQSLNISHLWHSYESSFGIYQAFPWCYWIKFSALLYSCAYRPLWASQSQSHSTTSLNFIIFSQFNVAVHACIMVFTIPSFKISFNLMHFCAFRKKSCTSGYFSHVCPSLWTHNLWAICPNGSLHFLMPRMLNPFFMPKGTVCSS